MGRIADQMKQHLDRLRELDEKQQRDIEKLLETTRKLIDELPTYED
jgi:restriction endonuclease S subunit